MQMRLIGSLCATCCVHECIKILTHFNEGCAYRAEPVVTKSMRCNGQAIGARKLSLKIADQLAPASQHDRLMKDPNRKQREPRTYPTNMPNHSSIRTDGARINSG